MKRQREEWIYGAIAAALGLMLIMGGVLGYMMAQQSIRQYKAVVGTVYRQDKREAEQILKQLFQVSLSGENIQAGELAAEKLGYGRDGYSNLYWSLTESWQYILYGAILAGLLFCIAILLFHFKKIEGNYLTDLCGRIGEAQEQLLPLRRSNEGSTVRMVLEKRIADLILTLEQQKNFFELRQEQMRQFIENVAHQLKTPLSCVVLNLDLIENKMRQEKKTAETEITGRSVFCLLEESMQQAEKMQRLLRQLLHIARLEAGKVHFQKENIGLYGLLKELCSLHPEGRYQLAGINPEEEVNIRGDREWLLEALENILVNAIRHRGQEQEEIQLQVTVLAESIKLRVIDRGTGMKQEQLEHLFDRFYTIQKAGNDSTGIGLNLAKLVIEGNYGSISAQSSIGNGTTVEIRLPLWKMKEKV